jgi:uncharacterized protein (DUF58 family)
MTGATDQAPAKDWAPTRAFGRAVLVVGIGVLAAVFTGRPDLVVLVAPIAIGAAIGLWRRPRQLPAVALRTAEPDLSEGAEFELALDVANADSIRYDLVVARVTTSRWLGVHNADRSYAATIGPRQQTAIGLHGTALRWGRHPIGPLTAHAAAADGLLVSTAATAPAWDMKVYPQTERFAADDAMPRAAGMMGFHRSRRPGEGGELAGVRIFSPGDRLRRIDWRVSLRTRELHVAATLSDRDAEVTLLLDLMHEAGQSGGIFGTRSVLDTTVRAAAGIAEHYLHRGDRVSFVEYGRRARRLRSSAGHRHFRASLEWLLDVRVPSGVREPPPFLVNTMLASTNALVVVLTPLIDHRSAAMLARLARSGRFVVAVDTLPTTLLDSLGRAADPMAAAGARLWRLERTNTLAQLREHGVPLVTWAGAGSLDEVLQQVSRMATGPLVVRR